jgi:hypothetical protein
MMGAIKDSSSPHQRVWRNVALSWQVTVFRHPQERKQPLSVSGVSIAFDRLLQVVLEDVRRTRHLSSFPSRQDTYVCCLGASALRLAINVMRNMPLPPQRRQHLRLFGGPKRHG